MIKCEVCEREMGADAFNADGRVCKECKRLEVYLCRAKRFDADWWFKKIKDLRRKADLLEIFLKSGSTRDSIRKLLTRR
jgi:hypothetical protein